tara:strand:- start:586 stop:1431 length:846 start_codon:yes stop_codon:yes gene_type:complete
MSYSEDRIKSVLGIDKETKLDISKIINKKEEITSIKSPDRSFNCQACNKKCGTIFKAKFKINGSDKKYKILLAQNCFKQMFGNHICNDKKDKNTGITWTVPCMNCKHHIDRNRREKPFLKINRSSKHPILIDATICGKCNSIDNIYFNKTTELESKIVSNVSESKIKRYIIDIQDNRLLKKEHTFETCYLNWVHSNYYGNENFTDSNKLSIIKYKIDNIQEPYVKHTKVNLCWFYIYITFHRYICKEPYISRIFFVPTYYAKFIFDECQEELNEIINRLMR